MINGKIIAIDARMIEMSGIGTYIQHLMGKGIYDYALGNENDIRKYDNDVKVIPFEARIYSIEEQLAFPQRAVEKAGIDLLHFPHYNVPISYRGKYVVTVHDLTHIVFPEFLGNRLKYYYSKFLLNHALKYSEHIFTVSNYSKSDIIKIFNIKPQKITVTYNAVDEQFTIKDKDSISYLYNKYEIPEDKRLLMYVGNLKPHKNLSRLLKAFSELNNKESYRLLLVGKSFSSINLKNEERLLNISNLVIHTGVVSKSELIDLYNLADLFIFPSLYEGFGIPPLEAMACGTPVIAAANSSIPEILGDAALYFDAFNVDEISKSITKAFNLDNKVFIKRGLQRVRMFDWNECSKNVKTCIENVVSNDSQVNGRF